MAEWFHRNPIKSTYIETFEFRRVDPLKAAPKETYCRFNNDEVATNGAAKKICSELYYTRSQLIDLLANPSLHTDVVVSMLNNYLALLHGFIVSPEEEGGGGESKLRHAIWFCWSSALNILCVAHSDALYEKICMLFNVAMWFSEHASVVAGKDDAKMEDALEVHKCLRIASGLYTLIKKDLVGQLKEPPQFSSSDLDPNIIDTYIHQCTAEAQEVTIGRAIELKHDSAVISSLAHETAKVYRLADAALTVVNTWWGQKWQKYLQFKAEIYFAYAYFYHGETLLAQDKCGAAIRCLQESQSHCDMASKVVKKYSSAWGTGRTVKLQENLFFRRLAPIVHRSLEKYVYENEFIYHQTVPMAVPSLGEKAAFGVATPEEFQMPPCHPFWTVDAYRAFDVTKLPASLVAAQTKPTAAAAAGASAAAAAAAAAAGEKVEPQ